MDLALENGGGGCSERCRGSSGWVQSMRRLGMARRRVTSLATSAIAARDYPA